MNGIKSLLTGRGKIEYLLSGEGPAVPIIHGGHGSCRSDYRQERLIEQGFSVLIPTRPGYGSHRGSGGTPLESGKTAEAAADLFAELLDALHIGKVSVIGNSAGGPAALEFAKRHQDKTAKLILEAAVVKPWFHPFTVQYYGVKAIFDPKRQRKFWDNLTAQLEKDERGTLLKNLKLFTKRKPGEVLNRMSPEDIQYLKKYMVTENDSGTGFIHDVEHRAKDIERIRCPVLIIHSRNDGSVPFTHAEYAHSKIRDSELFEAPTDSHFIYIGPGSEEVLRKRLEFLLA